MFKRSLVLLSLLMGISACTGPARAQDNAEYLLLWVIGNQDYIDSGMRFPDAGECYATAQNIGSSMQYVGLAPPRFFCIPLKPGHEFSLVKDRTTGSRNLLF